MNEWWQELTEGLMLIALVARAAQDNTGIGATVPLPNVPTLKVKGETWQLVSADGSPPVIKRLA